MILELKPWNQHNNSIIIYFCFTLKVFKFSATTNCLHTAMGRQRPPCELGEYYLLCFTNISAKRQNVPETSVSEFLVRVLKKNIVFFSCRLISRDNRGLTGQNNRI